MKQLDELTDSELMALANEGDEEAFETIYHRRRPMIYRYALHMTGTRQAAEDIAQEVFLTFIGKMSDFDPARGELSSYLLGFARKLTMRHFGRVAKAVPTEADSESSPAPESLVERHDPLSRLGESERVRIVREAVLDLPPRYREAVVLCDLEEMDYAEASVAAGCPVGTIRSRLHRARRLLAKKLQAPKSLAKLKRKRCWA
jgi:RNA polymerase sigma-70 factor (ECF subfamily)